jgi:hypothetical protein
MRYKGLGFAIAGAKRGSALSSFGRRSPYINFIDAYSS